VVGGGDGDAKNIFSTTFLFTSLLLVAFAGINGGGGNGY
jgi:hypothetical protein